MSAGKSHMRILGKKKEEPTQAPAGVQPVEGSHIGNHHVEQHEALRHNVNEGQTQRHPETPAGQHATGSFTGPTPAAADEKQKKGS